MPGRGKNEVETEIVKLSLTPGIVQYLSDLVQTGLFGRTPNAAAERLVELGVKAEINAGTIPRRALQPREIEVTPLAIEDTSEDVRAR